MKTLRLNDFSKWPPPPTALRECAFVCLAGAGVCVIVAAKTYALWAREMVSYLLCPLLAFVLLFAEYKIVELLLKRELDRRWGYAQVLGCILISLYGTIGILAAAFAESPTPTGLAERTLLWLCIFGEIAFVGNVVWTFRQEVAPASQVVSSSAVSRTIRQPVVTAASVQSSDWPGSPAVIFAIAGGFFAAMGVFMAKVQFLGAQVPVGWNGSTIRVPAGYLCASTALPFLAFAAIYFVLESQFGMRFELSATRIHFVCTLLTVLEAIHVYLGWASTWANTGSLANPVNAGDFGGAFALGALACGCLAWNVVASRHNALVRV